ncbi:MAG TPA: NYN domain-containing protein [Jiangellaceae bacterium]
MTTLPESVRQRVIAMAADVLGELAADETPPPLKAIARFAAAKRAKLGGTTIAAVLDADPVFRARVLETARTAYPGLVEAVSAGAPPAAADPADVATVAFLLRPEGWTDLVAAAGVSARRTGDQARAARDAAAAVRLREQLSAVRAEAREGRERAKADIDRLKAENATLRRQLNELRTRAVATEDAGRNAAAQSAHAVSVAEAGRAAADAEARRLRARLAEVEQALEATRRAGREGRSLETARLGLLLDTLAEAAAGLRRELALPASTVRPADTVDAREPALASASRRPGDDPGSLDDLLSLPQAHLIVDGYNVTKSAWPTMPLEGQRNRLVQGLGALAARTGAEITCVFDGADVEAPAVPLGPGVRVRFSPRGQTADELIRRLVAAEPVGRPVTVVSSDREVADGVRRSGARAVESTALVGLLG